MYRIARSGIVLGLLLTGLAVGVCAGDTLPPDLRTRKTGSDWPRFLGPTGDSVSTEKGIVRPWPKGGPRILWSKFLGSGYAPPTVSRGRLFLFERDRTEVRPGLFRETDTARLRCWKAETGEAIWSFTYTTNYRDNFGYNGGPRCCPVVDGDRVYIHGPEGMLHCVRVADGKLVWKVDTRATFGVVQNFFGVGSTPVIEGDLLLVQVGGSPRGSEDVPFDEIKGNGSGLVAFDKYTGKVRYRATDELASYASPVVASVGGRRRCLLFSRGALVGLDPTNGKVNFRFPWRAPMFESANASNPVVVGNQVFITECYGIGGALVEVGPKGVREVWTDKEKGRRRSLACHWMTPIHVDGYLYGSSGRHTREADLRCVELATGKVMWSEPNLTRCSLLLVDGHFVCLGEEGTLRLLRVNPKRYEEVSAVELYPQDRTGKPLPGSEPLLRDPCWAAPILAHGLLYVRGDDRLVCLELIPVRR